MAAAIALSEAPLLFASRGGPRGHTTFNESAGHEAGKYNEPCVSINAFADRAKQVGMVLPYGSREPMTAPRPTRAAGSGARA
jgi:hypothetical protein